MKSYAVHNKGDVPKLVRLLLILVVSIGAAMTVVTHVAQISGVSFSAYAVIGICVSATVATLVLWSGASKHLFLAVTMRNGTALVVLACALMGAALTLVSYRPSMDDAYYVPNAVYYLEHVNEPMSFKVHFLDSGGEPFISYHRFSIPFEYSQAVVAYIFGMQFLTVYHLLVPWLFGFMVPLVWFYLISRFSFPSRAAITGAVLICLSLLLMGEQHRSFGCFAFDRIFQGKTVLLAIIVPFFVALTIDFFRVPSRRNWLWLFVTSVTAVGLSTTAAVLMPLLASVLCISGCSCYAPKMRTALLRGFCYLCSLFYPALYALSILLLSVSQLGSDTTINRGWPVTFLGQARFVLGGPAVTLSMVMGTILAIGLLKNRDRRFLVIWLVLMLVLYLNPIIAPFIIEHITTPNIYWRLFYLLPFPLVIGLSGAGISLRLEAVKPTVRRLVFGAVATMLLVAHLVPGSPSLFRRQPGHGRATKLLLPGYKVPHLSTVRKVLSLAPPHGTMLAPQVVSCSLPLLTSNYPQIVIRGPAISMLMAERGLEDEATQRIRAAHFLGREIRGQNAITKENLNSFIWVIRNCPQIKSVVASRKAAKAYDSYVFRFLDEYGFTEHRRAGKLVVFMRPTSRE